MAAVDENDLQQQYLAHLQPFRLPAVVVATKSGPNTAECADELRDIHHDHWLIRFENPSIRRTHEVWIAFDSVVNSGGMRLNHPTLRLDYAMKKVMIIAIVTGIFGHLTTNNKHLSQYSQSIDWFIRFRLGVGLQSNELIQRKHYNIYKKILEKSIDQVDLVPIYDRIDEFITRVKRNPIALRQYLTSSRSPEKAFDWPVFASAMGVTQLSLSRSTGVRIALIDGFGQIGSSEADKIKYSISATGQKSQREVTDQPLVEDSNPDRGEEPPKLAEGTLKRKFSIWLHIYNYSMAGQLTFNRLEFDPFEELSARQTARRISKKGGRTRTIVPEDYIRVLKAGIRWTFDNSDYIRTAVRMLRDNTFYKSHPAWRRLQSDLDKIRPPNAPLLYLGWENGSAGNGDGRISVGKALRLLMASSAAVIGGFAVRRGTELEDLQHGCIEEGRPGVYTLTVYIEKTRRDLDRIPFPKAGKKAIAILESLHEGAAEDVQEPKWLFVIRKGTGFVGFKISAALQEFVEFVGLKPPVGESEWNLASHMLRRGYALFCYYGFDWSTDEDITYALGHFDPAVARIYLEEAIAGEIGRLNDELQARSSSAKELMTPEVSARIEQIRKRLGEKEESKAEFEEVRCEAYAYRMMCLHKRTDTAIGKGAVRVYSDLAFMVEQATADVRVLSRANDDEHFVEALMKRFKRHAATHRLQPVPGNVTHCSANPNSPADMVLAECMKRKRNYKGIDALLEPRPGSEDAIDFTFSGAYPCIHCEFCVALKLNQQVLTAKCEQLAEAVEKAPSAAAAAARRPIYEKFRAGLLGAKDVVADKTR